MILSLLTYWRCIEVLQPEDWDEQSDFDSPLSEIDCEMRLARSAEKEVEAEHAKSKHGIDIAPHHADAFVSLLHREIF